MNTNTLIHLRERLKQQLPGRAAQERMVGRVRLMPALVPENARPSAVLCLVFPVEDDLHILLMQRREDNTHHSGQVSFPGGRFEPEDVDYRATALREAHEEMGIPASEVEVLGELTSLYIPVSNYNVFPFLGYVGTRPVYNLNDSEVAHVLEVSLSSLFAAERKIVTDVTSPAQREMIKNVNAYKLEDGTIVWGATAMVLSEIEAVFSEILAKLNQG